MEGCKGAQKHFYMLNKYINTLGLNLFLRLLNCLFHQVNCLFHQEFTGQQSTALGTLKRPQRSSNLINLNLCNAQLQLYCSVQRSCVKTILLASQGTCEQHAVNLAAPGTPFPIHQSRLDSYLKGLHTYTQISPSFMIPALSIH